MDAIDLHDINPKALPFPKMIGIALILGVLSGLAAIVFHNLFILIRNLIFLGRWQYGLDVHQYLPPSHWDTGVILVPVIGAVLLVFISRRYGDQISGSGVPEVLYAIYYRKGLIAPMVALWRIIATAISVGTGAAVGRDGPMVQMGAALSSGVGQLIRMTAHQRDVLLAAGAGGAMAATFNAPIGALTFVLEMLLVSINAHNFAIVAVATLVGNYVGRLYFGAMPPLFTEASAVFPHQVVPWYQMVIFIPFGLLVGCVSYALITAVYTFKSRLDDWVTNPYWRHGSAMLLVGLILYGFVQWTGRYYMVGVVNAPLADMISQGLTDPKLLLILFLAKFLVTVLALGSGASGGAFSPALFLGASIGGTLGSLLALMVPGLSFQPCLFAIAGMASSMASLTGAAITGIVFVFERTRDYHAILPIIMAVAMANAMRAYLQPQTIYTYKAARQGFHLPLGLMAEFISARKAHEAATQAFQVVDEAEFNEVRFDAKVKYVLIKKQGKIQGYLLRQWVDLVHSRQALQSHINKKIQWLDGQAPWLNVLHLMRKRKTALILIGDHSNVKGVIGNDEIVQASQMTASLYFQ